jgi:hypothetical protein
VKQKLIRALGALILAPLGGLAIAAPAQGDPPSTIAYTATNTIKNTPDDGCPPWARDTFTRTTTIFEKKDGTYKVSIADVGTFVTQPGAASPDDPGIVIANKVRGSIEGVGWFHVTGELRPLGEGRLLPPDGKELNFGSYACKADVPAEKTTGKWALRFFKDGAQSSGIQNWKWKYTTHCGDKVSEKRVESFRKDGTHGNITGKLCAPVTVVLPADCEDPITQVQITNVNTHHTHKLRARVNGAWGEVVKIAPGETYTHELTAEQGAVQFKIDGKHGVPITYVTPTGCATPPATTPPATTPPATTPPPPPLPTTPPATTPPTTSPVVTPTTSSPPPPGLGGNDPDPVDNSGGLAETGLPGWLKVAGVVGLALVLVGVALLVYARRRSELTPLSDNTDVYPTIN